MAKKILFVEDDPALQNALKEAISKEGYDIIQAFDGQEGLDRAKENKPDLILLDLILPKKDGFAVLESLKADDGTKDIPVVVLTNLEGIGDVDRALSMGATTYLVKVQYELNEIVEKVKEILG
ncbi:MAG: response regulator [Candidatus Spechtbacteria bacterium]|nr:response regulator [Candidatus Spechtbacteria bacterium]